MFNLKVSITNNINNFIFKGHDRSVRAKKNIIASFVIKGLNIVIGAILVPITISYLNPTKYGIWITFSSIIGWFGFFDIGLGHGLRNRFAEALAAGRNEQARIYVSTTYGILSFIVGGILVVFYIINHLLDWSSILNAGDDIVLQKELGIMALIVFTFFCLRFVFKLITTILTADQKPAKASLFDLIAKILTLVLIIILSKTTTGSLLYLGVIMSSTPVFILVLSSAWFFNGKYKSYRPSFKLIDYSKAGDLLNLGVKFFVIQIASILLYQTNNIIISHLFGPDQVTPYYVAFTYFATIMMGFSIILSPFWSAITEAWAKKDLEWIKNTIGKLTKVWGFLFLACLIMLISSPWVYRIWIGDGVTITYTMSAFVGVWALINSWNGIYSNFLNGVGKIKLQLYLGIFAAVLNVPLAILLGKKIGIEGILLSNIMLAVLQSLIYPIQYKKIICNNANGIWNK